MNRSRRLRIVLLAVVLGAAAARVLAQNGEHEMFVREVVEAMRTLGWQNSELEGVATSMGQYSWEQMDDVDPEAVALAMRYGRESGLVIEDPESTARWAFELAVAARQMVRTGMGPREVARASVNSMRALAASRRQERDVIDLPNIGVQIGEQVRSQLRLRQSETLRTGGESRPSGPTRNETWRSSVPGAFGSPSAPGGQASGPPTGPPGSQGDSGVQDQPGSDGGGAPDSPAGGSGPGPGEPTDGTPPGSQNGGPSGGAG